MLDTWDGISMAVHANGGELYGRVVMQKIMYFATRKITSNAEFFPHYFGPYSRDVAIAVDGLINTDFLDYKILPAGPYKEFRYSTSKKGIPHADKLKNDNPEHYEIIREIVDTCKLHRMARRPLECAAKVHYVQTSERDPIPETAQMRDMCAMYGWTLSDRNVEEGRRLLGDLNLAVRA